MPIFTLYWGGYFITPPSSEQKLNDIPTYVDYVILAFAGPTKDSTIETSFLCSRYSSQLIKTWIKILQNKGIKVLMSLLDTPETHWDNIDLSIFANSVKEIVIDEWGCDGLDIDAESGMNPNNYVNKFVELATKLRKVIGDDLILTYTCYMGTNTYDGDILKQIKDKINWIQLMAYFNSFNSMINLYNDYKTIMNDNICIGVKAGEPDMTPINEVKKLCKWNSKKKGIMLWTYNRDTSIYTNKPPLTWCHTIYNNLKKQPKYKLLCCFSAKNTYTNIY